MNPETRLTLDEAVAEVLGLLTGLELRYEPELDRYRAVTRALNRGLRGVAVEKEWSYYASTVSIGHTAPGAREVFLPASLRPRIIGDDAVQLVREADDHVVRFAYFLPRDAIGKYEDRSGLWVAVTRQTLLFSRPFYQGEVGLEVRVPVMREPTMFRLPEQPEDPDEPLVSVPQEIRGQPVDFPFPDLVVLRAAFYYAQTDPVLQPRVQTLEAQYKDMMYQLIERDARHTDAPTLNEFRLPLASSSIPHGNRHHHPHSDEWI